MDSLLTQMRPTRRRFLEVAALATLLQGNLEAAERKTEAVGGLPGLPHFTPKAKRVIYLFQSGAPSQMDLFDYKPKLDELRGTELPDSIRKGQRLTGMTSTQERFPRRAVEVSLSPGTARAAPGSASCCRTPPAWSTSCASSSRCTPRRSITTRPSLSSRPAPSWPAGPASAPGCLRPGQRKPATCRPSSSWSRRAAAIPTISRSTIASGAAASLPTQYQGVKFRSVGDPVLYLSNPPASTDSTRRRMLDDLAQLNQMKLDETGDPEIATRIAQYEMAYRMQTSVPELTDMSQRAASTSSSCTAPMRASPARFAANCLLARRLAERGVRFIQLFHRGWDQHTQPAEADRRPVPRHRSALGGADHGPEAARPAGRHAGGLGRRVRPDGLLPGQADRGRLRPRPSSALLHHLAGRRRHQARHDPRRDRRLLLQHHAGPGPRPRPARHDAALPGHRPHAS